MDSQKITTSKRLRRAKTFSRKHELQLHFDGFTYRALVSRMKQVYEFVAGDVVEFVDPATNEWCRRTITIKTEEVNISRDHYDRGYYGQTTKAFVRVGRKKTRVLEAPLMRLVGCAVDTPLTKEEFRKRALDKLDLSVLTNEERYVLGLL